MSVTAPGIEAMAGAGTADPKRAMAIGRLPTLAAVLDITRVTRTTTTPLGSLSLAARPDRFEVEYLISS